MSKQATQTNHICIVNFLVGTIKKLKETGKINFEKSEGICGSIVLHLFEMPMGCNLPGSSLHGILQARILEWVAIPFSRASS